MFSGDGVWICLPAIGDALGAAGWLTSMPSFNNSPWMRGAPHNEFSRLIRRMSSRISFEVRGRPGFPWRDFHFQNTRNPWRCQPMTVSGLTMTADFPTAYFGSRADAMSWVEPEILERSQRRRGAWRSAPGPSTLTTLRAPRVILWHGRPICYRFLGAAIREAN